MILGKHRHCFRIIFDVKRYFLYTFTEYGKILNHLAAYAVCILGGDFRRKSCHFFKTLSKH